MAELALTEGQHGQRFTVHTGDTITIALPENSAAGYRWTTESLDETRLAVRSQGYQGAGEAIGSAGTTIWRLTATRPGSTRIELVKARPWEHDHSTSDRFHVDLDIVE